MPWKSSIGAAILVVALAWLVMPDDARAQWAESFGLNCPGQWVAGGTMCLCPNGQYAAYINGQVTCPGGGGGAGGYPGESCGWGSCPAGTYCAESGVCVPNGAAYCGGGQSCPAGTKCSLGGGCLPQEATDCGDGSHCPGGTLCWQDPPDTAEYSASPMQCLTVEEYADRTERLRQEQEKNSPEAKERRAEAERKVRERAAAEKREVGSEKKKAAEDERALERDRKAQEKRLLSDEPAKKDESLDRSAAEIMRELRENSLLDRLNQTPPGQPAALAPRPAPAAAGTGGTSSAATPSGFPSRQTPAPPQVDTAGRESRRLADRVPAPAPQPSMATAPPPQSQGPGRSWVQDFAATGQVDPAKMPPAAREDHYERLKREAAAAAQAQRAKDLEAERAYYENYRWDGGSNARISERQKREAAEAARADEIAKAISERQKREAAVQVPKGGKASGSAETFDTRTAECVLPSPFGCEDVVGRQSGFVPIERQERSDGSSAGSYSAQSSGPVEPRSIPTTPKSGSKCLWWQFGGCDEAAPADQRPQPIVRPN